mgnify:CR=1 FL=1
MTSSKPAPKLYTERSTVTNLFRGLKIIDSKYDTLKNVSLSKKGFVKHTILTHFTIKVLLITYFKYDIYFILNRLAR